MSSPHKRPLPPLGDTPSNDTVAANGQSSCEPPVKKLRQSQDSYAQDSSQLAQASTHASKVPPMAIDLTGNDDDDDDGLESDEFESLEELLSAPPPNHTTPATARGVTSQPKPVSHVKAEYSLPKVDPGEESDDCQVIDLTKDDTEIHIGRSDGFVGVIKPGTPGAKVKREGSYQSPSIRRALAPISANTPSRQRGDLRSTYSGTLSPGVGHTGVMNSSLMSRGDLMPVKAEYANELYAGAATPPGRMQQGGPWGQRQTPSALKYEDPSTPAYYPSGSIKLEDEKKPTLLKRPAIGRNAAPRLTSSPVVDMAKLHANEKNLAAMPCAPEPAQLKTKLLKHQLQALQWMINMEQSDVPSLRLAQLWGRDPYPDTYYAGSEESTADTPASPFSGGILADDMGLGKTLEMIALMLSEPGSGPTLVVAPKGVMTNWESQIRRHIRWNHALRMFRYHGSRCYATPRELERNDVVITTYNKVGDQLYGEGVLCKVRWRRIILDEGHNIRNPGSKAALGACKLLAESRWVCTGTPIVNSVKDIFSLSKFIRVTATLGKKDTEIMRRLRNDPQFLQKYMTTICLRRTKEMGFVNLQLPPKEEELIRIEFSEAERPMYQKLFEDAQQAAKMFFKSGHIALWNTLLERLLRLRQMCDHWTLCRKKGMEKYRKELDEILCAANGNPVESQSTHLLRLSLQAKIACGICNEPLDYECGPVIIPCAHVFCKPCLLTPSEDMISCPVCNNTFSTTNVTELPSMPTSTHEVPAKNDHSSKTQALMSIVKERLRNKGSKIVIFSQWTSFLDIVSSQLDEEGVGHTRIDGTMSTSERDEAVKALQSDPRTRVMLASLRAAGVGISLVAADTAILADSWWAPAIEEQAVDRVHRLGQTRPTKVYRLVIKGAVEEDVIRIQDRKRELVGTAFQEEFKSLADLGVKGMIRELLG